MIGSTISHYKILEKLGEGGMGIVYKAEDTKLKRHVALKFISPLLTQNKEVNKGFIYEAQTASALDHQNISTIYEIDETDDGRVFISMAYYNGETLREKISRGEIPANEAINIVIQIAEGLSGAHRKGIIHKDVKPANIIIDEENIVKIIDFGLSKLLSANKQIQLKNRMGTLAYMSPEEIKGKMIDFRTDIWSLGIIMYEMLTGMRPFEGDYDQEVTYSIFNEEPEPMSYILSNVPKNLESIIIKALSKKASDRYPHIEAMLLDLRNLTAKVPNHLLGVSEFSREVQNEQKPIQSIAVLPLVNLSNDLEQEYFTDGMTDALITDLAKIRTLKIISRTSIMCYKGTNKSLPEIAEELKVDAVVEGTVLKEGTTVQITVQLINALTDTHLWAETYNRELDHILILQSELAQAIANEINVTLTKQEKRRITFTRPINPEPYDNYLKGCFHLYKGSSVHYEKALEYFHLSLEKDKNFALAYVGIAQVLLFQTYWEVTALQESMEKAKIAVDRVLELDDTIAEGHDVLARIKFFYDWDWKGAEKEFLKAIKLNPNYSNTHLFYSAFLRSMKRDGEAFIEVKRGLELDPINFLSHGFYIGHLLHLNKYEEAIEKLNEILKSEPNFPMAHRYLWISYYQKKMYDKALEEAKIYFTVLGKNEIADVLEIGNSKANYKQVMNLAAKKMEKISKRTFVRSLWIARLHSYAGNKNSALKWLLKAFKERDSLLVNLRVSRDWDSLRGEPEFQVLLQKMNLLKV